MEVQMKTVKVEATCCSVTENSCRLCLLDDGIKINIFDDEGTDRNVADKISACFPIMVRILPQVLGSSTDSDSYIDEFMSCLLFILNRQCL